MDDTFVTFMNSFFGKGQTIEQIATAFKLNKITIQFFTTFATNFIVAQLTAGHQPTTQEIIDEWHKTHPPAHYESAGYADYPVPLGSQGSSGASTGQDVVNAFVRTAKTMGFTVS